MMRTKFEGHESRTHQLVCSTSSGFFGAPEVARYLAPVANALAPIGASVLTRSDEVTAEDIAGMVQLGVPGLTPSQDCGSTLTIIILRRTLLIRLMCSN